MECDSEWQKMMSLRLSSVLDDIGVTKTLIRRRRRTLMSTENMLTIGYGFDNFDDEITYVGSQVEGTTTIGLSSDLDMNIKFDSYVVIGSVSEFCPRKKNLLMVTNENTAPQHCWLQRLRTDVALPAEVAVTSEDVQDQQGRILMTHDAIDTKFKEVSTNVLIDGPSRSWFYNIDIVVKFPCLKLPEECKYMSRRPRPGHWPFPETIQKIGNCETCVIPQGFPSSANPKIEWRFSTSQMERMLMFDLNLVQIKVYVLLKILRKCFIEPLLGDRLSSFHLKTALLFTVENYNADIWTDTNIVMCVIMCLETLLRWARIFYMPHYFISDVNLFTGKLSKSHLMKLSGIITDMIVNNLNCIFFISIDDLGQRMTRFYSDFQYLISTAQENLSSIARDMFIEYCYTVVKGYMNILNNVKNSTLFEAIYKLCSFMHNCYNLEDTGDSQEKETASVLLSFLCGILASILASYSISFGQGLASEHLDMYSCSMQADMLSMKLKFASALYCSGEFESAARRLAVCEALKNGNTSMCQYCCCWTRQLMKNGEEFSAKAIHTSNLELLRTSTALCVRFTLHEQHCVPSHLVYEMFRTTGPEYLQGGHPILDCWMDLAVIDAIPFLYYLQYLTCRQIYDHNQKQVALQNLLLYVRLYKEDGGHPETAINILSHCYEMYNRPDIAWKLYKMSMRICPTKNACVWHMMRLVQNQLRKAMGSWELTKIACFKAMVS